jgi:hypothetical protein
VTREERRKAARLLRRIVAAFTDPDGDTPPRTPRGAAMLRRLEGAAIALETDANLSGRQPRSRFRTADDRILGAVSA